jgi:putative transposase
MVTTKQRRQVVTQLLAAFANHRPSARRVCRLVELSRSRWHYRTRRLDDAEWRDRLKAVAAEKPQWGYELLYDRLRRGGWIINHKKVAPPLSGRRARTGPPASPETRGRSPRPGPPAAARSAGAWTS